MSFAMLQWSKATLLDTCDGNMTLHNAQQVNICLAALAALQRHGGLHMPKYHHHSHAAR